MNSIEILTLILLISALILCYALIYSVYQFIKSVQSIEADIHNMSVKLGPLVHSAIVLSDKLTQLTSEAEDQLQISKSILSDIREYADKILSVETIIRNGIEDAVMPVFKNINAVGKGIKSFWKKYKNNQVVK